MVNPLPHRLPVWMACILYLWLCCLVFHFLTDDLDEVHLELQVEYQEHASVHHTDYHEDESVSPELATANWLNLRVIGDCIAVPGSYSSAVISPLLPPPKI